jgi:ribonuclease D
LAYLQFKLLGLRSEKAHQADDWVRRPLQASQLRYAASDVDHLPKMTSLLLEAARENDRVETLYAASHDALHPVKEPPPRLTLSSFRNAWQLSPRSQAALRYLMSWYNELSADERRFAPENKVLLSIASRAPEDLGSLGRIKGVSRGTVNQHGRALVSGLAAAIESAQGSDFVPLDPPPYSTYEEIRLDAWLAALRADLAVSLEFAPEFVLPGRLQKRMKAGLEASGLDGLFEALVGWRKEFLAGPVRRFCETRPPPV